MNKIYWLASYPKSGNTWVRVFITNYLHEENGPAEINKLRAGIASERDLFDRWAGVEASDLSFEEIANLRPQVYRQMALHTEVPIYLKVHDACTRNNEGELLFPLDITGGVVYIIRNPLDVAVSYAHHGGRAIEKVVAQMCDLHGYVYEDPSRLPPQLPQQLLSWSDHARSWIDNSGMTAEVIRYEDMLVNPEVAFTRIIQTLDLSVDPQKISTAVTFSRFEALHEQESHSGFRERPLKADAAFFRNGRAGSWRTELPADLAGKIIQSNKEVMHRFGYINENDEPLY